MKYFLVYEYTLLEQNTVVITGKKIDLKPICCYLCLLWGTCIKGAICELKNLHP